MDQTENVEQQEEQVPTANAEAQSTPSLTPEALLALLCEHFPRCFIERGECRPLKIGILDSLAQRTSEWPGVSKTRLREVLRRYTNTTRYLQGVANGAKRVDLDGEDAGEVAADHVTHAQEQLTERRARHKAEAKARGRSRAEGTAANDGASDQPRSERGEGRPPRGPRAEGRVPRPEVRSQRPRPDQPRRPRPEAQPRAEAKSAEVTEFNDLPIEPGKLAVSQRVKVQTGARPVYGTVVAMQGENVQVGLDNGLSVWVKSEALSLATAKA